MTKAPILLLHELEQRSQVHAHGLPQRLEVKASWEGIGFRMAEHHWVIPLEQVKEILQQVELSYIPGAKEWVRGIANVRGTLLPILDLSGFLLDHRTKMTTRSRILVMQHKGIAAGLLVEEVVGMRHFHAEEFSDDISDIDVSFRQMLLGQYRQFGESWGVFSINHLTDIPEFMQVAA